MKTVLIVGNGNSNSKSFYEKLSKEADFIIGVDGGAGKLIKYDIRPDIAIGDFDSIRRKEFLLLKDRRVNILQFPKDKDYSDAELAVRFALKNSFDEFILSGMLGKRVDHMLFNVSLLHFLIKKEKDAKIIEESEEIYITRSRKKININRGETVSLYPITDIVTNVTTIGLKYPLKGQSILKGKTLTLSNIAVSCTIQITVGKGTLLIIVEKR